MRKLTLIIAIFSAAVSLKAQEQLPNMNFDTWSKSRGVWSLWRDNAPASARIWGTPNKTLSIIGKVAAEPEDEIVAVKGPGKRAAKLHSEKVLWAFSSGSIFSGTFIKLTRGNGAEITWGAPFHSRPKAMTGYYYYIPKPIDNVRKPWLGLKGKMDVGQVEVILADWDEPYIINTSEGKYVDIENDPHIIGRGYSYFGASDGYVHFNLPVVYRNDRTPKWAVVIACSSRYGGEFTGGDGSVLYVDEFSFVY